MRILRADSALKYWFFKVNAGPIALLVDWIVYSQRHEQWMRISIHTPTRRTVLVDRTSAAGTRSFLTSRHTAGSHGEVQWNLAIEDGDRWLVPDIFPARATHMPDLILATAPRSVFRGWITYDGQRFGVEAAPGVLSHYWGRQLAPSWWWAAAHQFDRPDVVVECSVMRSHLWGSPMRLPLGYLYLRDGTRELLLMSPPNRIRVNGTPAAFTIEFRRWLRPSIILRAVGSDYGDLGDRIVNTLVGNLEVWEGRRLLAHAAGTAALERRAPDAHDSLLSRSTIDKAAGH